ncbi:MAG: UDP-N-acetylmuramate--L-alanine ligase [Firmicutes bacterium]|nr:UDP-N-acetylmuramate--L-alanine ligase [Bacillota bacterium]
MESKLHFIGIGGIGMSAIAKIMLHMGYQISGSDVKEGRLTQELVNNGARICYQHAAANIPSDAEAVVYSSAVKDDNPEMVEARRRGLKIYKRADALAFLMSTGISIGVAGAHGKTTTSAMISTMLDYAGCDPTIIIGGMLPTIGGSNAKAGDGQYLVAEADESDGTFLLLHPTIAVVTNIEADHLDFYEGLNNIIRAFEQYLRQVPEDGFAVYCADCPICRDLAYAVPGCYVSYALNEDADYTAKNITQGNGVAADIYYHGDKLGRLNLAVPGTHNIANAMAAIAVGRKLGLDFSTCAEGLARFRGTGRRFEKMGEFNGLTVIDDYAHHPTVIKRTIEAARGQGAKKLTVVFQPHRYSRTQSMYAEFAEALMDADKVVLCEIYPAFERPIPGVSAKLIADCMADLGHQNVIYTDSLDATYQYLKDHIADEDMLLIMGAGNIRSVSERFAQDRRECQHE